MDRKLRKTICWLAVILFAITEGLSFFNALTRRNIIILWLIAGVVFLVVKRKKLRIAFTLHSVSCDIIELLMFFVCASFCVRMGILAYETVPNNFDSMTYHLPRITNWIQNRSTDYFATNSIRQLYSPVFAEYVVMHICLITKSDLYVNMVQWLAYCIDAYVVYSICRKLNLNKYMCYIGTVLFLSMPMAVAQSVTTQVDLVGTMWLLFFVEYVIEIADKTIIEFKCPDISLIFECALTVAFGYLTKSNVCYPMVVMLIWLLIKRLQKRDKILDLVKLGFCALVIIAGFVLPTFIRNYISAGDILAMEYMSGIMVGTFNPALFFINIYKNMALLISTDLLGIRDILVKGGVAFSSILGVNINDPAISMSHDFAGELPVSYHHDFASNPLVAVLFIITVLIWVINIIFKRIKTSMLFYFVFIISIMSSICLLRYQVWGSRLMLPACAMM